MSSMPLVNIRSNSLRGATPEQIAQEQHKHARRSLKRGKSGVSSESSLNPCAVSSVVQARIAALNRLEPLIKGTKETRYWTTPKLIDLGWPLTVLDCLSGRELGFGRVQKVVDLSREHLQCVSVKCSDKRRIISQLHTGGLKLEREATDLAKLEKLVQEWREQEGVALLFVREKEAKLVFCIKRPPRPNHNQ